MTDQIAIPTDDVPLTPEQTDATAAFFKLDVTEQLRALAEATPDPVVERVMNSAIGEIEYLRGVFGSVERGARPFGDFWNDLRRRDSRRRAVTKRP